MTINNDFCQILMKKSAWKIMVKKHTQMVIMVMKHVFFFW